MDEVDVLEWLEWILEALEVVLAGPVRNQSLEAHLLCRTLLASLCLLLEGLSLEVKAVKMELSTLDHVDEELHGHLEELASRKHPLEVDYEGLLDVL